MANLYLTPLDFHLLYYFVVIAEEGSIQAAARKLSLSQPPLSRQLHRLEEKIGYSLFMRHSKGLVLTEEGQLALEIVRPLVNAQIAAYGELAKLGRQKKNSFAIGLTTAFEQGVFADVKDWAACQTLWKIQFKIKSSPGLVRQIQSGRLDIAFVALPLATAGLACLPLQYGEPLMAVLPASWQEGNKSRLVLGELSGKSLFWFKREQNAAFFDHMREIFSYLGFSPNYMEEPPEHDVLLGRIAAGEGFALLPASFVGIRRDNVAFIPLAEADLLRVDMGLVYREGNRMAEEVIGQSCFGNLNLCRASCQ